jgi:hypothetical protein
LTTEQLQNARAERWRQKSNPALTAEDAKAWIEDIGLCLFLPRRGNFLAAAPSFVEAAMGAPSEVPGREAVENATGLMRRLAADAAVIPLNLFGNSGSDQPDFLASRATLPYVFSLIGGRNWKSGPGMKASPLMTDVWTLLNDGEARTTGEIQAALGRELTEAAVLRALAELWHGLRAVPVLDGDVTRWELTQARFAAEMTASQKVAQTTALSALVSLYLDGAVAASSEEIETILSPLTARSRVREVVNGLSATRQLGLISVGAQPLLHVAGALPEFEEEEAEAKPKDRGERRPSFERRERAAAEGGAGRKPFERRERPQPGRERPSRTGFDRGGRRERTDRERTGPPRERRESARPGADRFAARGEARLRPERRPEEGERRAYGKKPFEKSQRSFGARPFDREKPRGEGGGKFPPKKFGKGGPKPWQDGGERAAREGERQFGKGERPFRPRREEERGGERRSGKFGGEGRPAEKRFSGGFKREKPGEKRPFFRERAGKLGGEDRPREARTGEGGRPFRPRREEERGGERRTGGWKGKPAGGGFSKSGGRGFGKSGKPGFKSGSKPPYKSGGKAGFRSEGGSGFKKPGFGKQGKPFGKFAGPSGKSGASGKSGRPPQGKGKPGGFKPPFRKRKKEGDGGGE